MFRFILIGNLKNIDLFPITCEMKILTDLFNIDQ